MKPVIVAAVVASMFGQVQENRNTTLTDRKVSLARIIRDVSEYEFSMGESVEQKLTRSSAPVLRWNHPMRGVDDAVVFVWSDEDRPEVVGTVMSFRSNVLRRTYEFVSLCEHPVSAVRDGKRVWYPSKPGIEWKPLPDAPVPAATAPVRLSQMRTIAGTFSSSVELLDGERYELRLLTQPIHRYGRDDTDLLDGAMFAFADRTDPELLVLLEVRKSKEANQWWYALARMSALSIEVKHKSLKIQTFQRLPFGPNPTGTYTNPEEAGPLDLTIKEKATREEKEPK